LFNSEGSPNPIGNSIKNEKEDKNKKYLNTIEESAKNNSSPTSKFFNLPIPETIKEENGPLFAKYDNKGQPKKN
jgi:hypothetical protein